MKKYLREAILWYAIQYDGDWTKIANAIQKEEEFRIVEYPYSYVTIVDEEYPACFRCLRYPPWILFYQGHLEWLDSPCVGIVGARKCSYQALVNTETVVSYLKKKYVIVSGLAKGIDAQSHLSSLNAKTIGIIGCGIDGIYPKENRMLYSQMRKEQLILSEYPMGVDPLSWHFPWRNRLIAACVNSLIVIEATYKSGTMLTVKECIELGKPIYCLPSAFENKDYPGCNLLISQGANIICDEKDLAEI